MAGIIPPKLTENPPLNPHNTIIIILAVCNVILYVNVWSEANNFEEYLNFGYNIISACISVVVFSTILYKTAKLFAFIDNLDKAVQERKLKLK